MLRARAATPDRVAGLDAGADDHLPRPFELDELLARLRALLRRATSWADGVDRTDATPRVGALQVDPADRRAWWADRELGAVQDGVRPAGADVTAASGAKGRRDPRRTAVRHRHGAGSVTLRGSRMLHMPLTSGD